MNSTNKNVDLMIALDVKKKKRSPKRKSGTLGWKLMSVRIIHGSASNSCEA